MSDGSVIIDTKLDNSDLKKEINKLNGLIDKGMKGALVSIGALTAGITGLGVSSLKFGTDYQKASNQLQASTGATEEEMNKLNETMKKVYANNFGESMEDVANAVSLVKQEMGYFESQDDLQKTTQDAIALRDTFQYDISESVRSAQALINNFGVSSERAFDLITVGSQRGLNYSGELLDNISEYSVQFAKLGLSAEDMFTIFDNGVQAGAFNLDKIGDAVKEFSIRAIDGSNTTIEGFTKLGLNADEMAQKFANGGDTAKEAFYQVITQIANMDDKVQQSIVGVDLFGTMWEDLGPEVVTQLASIRDGYNEVAGSADKLSQIKYNDLGSAIQGIGRMIQTNLLLPIGEKLLPAFNELANKLNEAFSNGSLDASIEKISTSIGGLVSGVANFVEQWLPKIISFASWIIKNAPTIISIISGIAVGLKTIQIATKIVDIVKGFMDLKNTITSVGGVFKALSAIMAVNPFVLIIGAIVGLVTTLIILWNTNEDFRNAVINIWNGIKTAISNVINGIITFFTETVPSALQGFIQFWVNLGTNIKNTFINAWNAIVIFFTETIPQWIQNVITWFQQLPYNIGLLIGTIIGHIIQFGVNIWNWITTELPKIIQEIIEWFKQLPGKIWEWLLNAINNIKTWGQNTYNSAVQWVSNTINGIIEWFKQLPGKIWEWLTSTINNIINWGRDMAEKGKTAALDLVNNIINTITELPGKVLDIGKNIVEGLWNGITGMGGWIKDKVSGFFSGIVDGVKGVLGIHSPSRVFRDQIGKNMALGVGEGFNKSINEVYKRMKSVVDFETQKLATNLSTTANVNRSFNANIKVEGSDIYMDSTKVGRAVTPTITKTLKGAGAY